MPLCYSAYILYIAKNVLLSLQEPQKFFESLHKISESVK